MKTKKAFHFLQDNLPDYFSTAWEMLQQIRKKYPLSVALFLALCFNLIIAPGIYAATGNDITRTTAYALGLLVLITLGLSIYLFVVIFQPEKF